MSLAKQSPSMATMANAAAGVAACGLAVSGAPDIAALMILLAVLLDFLDGALARHFSASSAFGAQLDSMSDLISFGIAPAVVVGSLIPAGAGPAGWALVSVYPLCAAWRLARFNAAQIEGDEVHGMFMGLPTTGAGAAAATVVLLHGQLPAFPQGAALLPGALVLLGALMVSNIPYRHAGSAVARLRPSTAAVLTATFVGACFLWPYEYVFAGLIWYYVLSGPAGVARERIRAVRHA